MDHVIPNWGSVPRSVASNASRSAWENFFWEPFLGGTLLVLSADSVPGPHIMWATCRYQRAFQTVTLCRICSSTVLL